MKRHSKFTSLLLSACITGIIAPQANAIDVTASDDENALVNGILGSNSNINVLGSPTYSGSGTNASGFFSNGTSGVGIDEGVLLSTGDAEDAEGPNTSESTSVNNGLPGDSDLENLVSNDTNNAATLEFDFQFGDGSQGGDLFFNYAFGSEEYTEYVGSQFNDVFGLFVDGTNIAKLPNGDVVSINNVNQNTNSQFYNNNEPDSGPLDTEYDGVTDVLQAQAQDLSPGTHTLKLGVADTSDSSYDSGLAIEGNSVTDNPNPNQVPFEAEGTMGLVALGGFLGYRYFKKRKQALN